MHCLPLLPRGRDRESVAEESMIAIPRQKPRFRFAPSPNGPLHLGHALSAILNHDMAQEVGGHFLLRVEDIDGARCTPEFETGILDDLAWLELSWEEPVRRQSDHFADYAAALTSLIDRGLVYPAFMTRGEVKARLVASEAEGRLWPRDPDGTPLYPAHDRDRSTSERRSLLDAGVRHAWRLDMDRALAEVGGALSWSESGDAETGEIAANPAAWGDVVLSRSDAPSSYHLSVVLDDALQGITHVVRGLDLFHATSIHRLLQVLLGLPQPLYHHHRLITDDDGRKLSKSERDAGIAQLREQGLSAADIRRRIGL
jgi:glutamyl-Q tRNA(Asp) synthetase